MLSYEMTGQGKPVVLLHAFPINSRMWAAQAKLFSREYQIVCPDLPGFGKSAVMKNTSMAAMAREVAAVLEHLKITGPVFLGGLSMGGYVAFEFLRQFPNRVGALGLFATRVKPDSDQARENRFKSIEAIQKFGLPPFTKKAIKSQLGPSTQQTHPELITDLLEIMNTTPVEGAVEALKAMASRNDSSDSLAGVKVPALIIAGEEDSICPADEMRAMHEQIPSSQFHVLPKSGHLVNLEQPELFNEKLGEFLRANGRK